MQFSKWLRRQIESKLMTQSEFALRAGVSLPSLSRWLAGSTEINGVNRERICIITGISRDQLDRMLRQRQRDRAA